MAPGESRRAPPYSTMNPSQTESRNEMVGHKYMCELAWTQYKSTDFCKAHLAYTPHVVPSSPSQRSGQLHSKAGPGVAPQQLQAWALANARRYGVCCLLVENISCVTRTINTGESSDRMICDASASMLSRNRGQPYSSLCKAYEGLHLPNYIRILRSSNESR